MLQHLEEKKIKQLSRVEHPIPHKRALQMQTRYKKPWTQLNLKQKEVSLCGAEERRADLTGARRTDTLSADPEAIVKIS